MAKPFQDPTQETSEDTSVFHTMAVFNHVVQTVLNINKAEAASFQHWMTYMDYNNFKDPCIDFQTELKNIIELKVSNVLEICHHEQTQVDHHVDVNKNEGHHHLNFLLSIFLPLPMKTSMSSGKQR